MLARRLRIPLLYLLMLLVSAQALAASGMGLCDGSHHGSDHAEHSGMAHDHHGHASMAVADPAPDAMETSGLDACQLCAASCLAAGVVTSTSVEIPFTAHTAVALGGYRSFLGHIAETPRKPPRFSL